MSPPISTAPADEGFLDTGDGHRLYWASYGPVDAPPLLMVHGGHGAVFDMDKMTLPPNRRVIVLHQRGIGKSEPLGSLAHNTLDDNVRDIERLREHLGIEKWDVFAWSFGAVYMMSYAAAYPARCNSLTAYAPYLATEQDWDVVDRSFFAHHGAANATEYTKNAFENLASGTVGSWFESLYNTHKAAGGTLSFPDFVTTRTIQEWDRKFKESLVGALHEKQALADRPAFWLAAQTTTAAFAALPVTLVYSDGDPWAAPHTGLARICPQAQILQIPAETHDVHDAVVQKYLSTVFQNLKSDTSPAAKTKFPRHFPKNP